MIPGKRILKCGVCYTLNGAIVTSASCPVHGLDSAKWPAVGSDAVDSPR